MGGSGLYHPPVKNWSGIASWDAHTRRSTPSTEPGVDWYCPRLSPLYAAAAGHVVDVSDGIKAATGRYITIDLADGHRVRYLHLESRLVNIGDRVEWGQQIGYTGATGYGESDWSWNVAETGGAHVHQTIFPNHAYVFGRYATLDPWPLTDTTKKDENMPLSNADLVAILDAKFSVTQNGESRMVSIADALRAVYFYGDRFETRIPGQPARPDHRALDTGDGQYLVDLIKGVGTAAPVQGGEAAQPILDAIKALPKETVAAIKEAL